MAFKILYITRDWKPLRPPIFNAVIDYKKEMSVAKEKKKIAESGSQDKETTSTLRFNHFKEFVRTVEKCTRKGIKAKLEFDKRFVKAS